MRGTEDSSVRLIFIRKIQQDDRVNQEQTQFKKSAYSNYMRTLRK